MASSLNVEPGELRAVIGPNGAGKTTFFNLISGFFPPTTGRIAFDGEDVTAVPAHQRVAMGMARTFQITEIFPELSRCARTCASRSKSLPGCRLAALDQPRGRRADTRHASRN